MKNMLINIKFRQTHVYTRELAMVMLTYECAVFQTQLANKIAHWSQIVVPPIHTFWVIVGMPQGYCGYASSLKILQMIYPEVQPI